MKKSIILASFLIASPLIAGEQTANPTAVQEVNTQTSNPAPAPNVLVVGQTPASNSVLRTGTPVSLRLLDQITTKEKKAKLNDIIRFEIAENVIVNDVVVIPAGSLASGELTEVRYKGMWGKSGRFSGRALNVNVNGKNIRLSGTFTEKGSSGGGGAVAVSALVFLPAGFFMTGKSAELPAGTIVRAFIDEDVPFVVQGTPKPADAPMVITTP
jgi:hypothetical protein